MKILYVVKTNKGAVWALEQAIGLTRLGSEITVVLPEEDGGTAAEYKRHGIKIIAADLSLPLSCPWRLPGILRRAREILSEEAPDIIHCHFVTNIMVFRLALGKGGPARVFQVPGPLHLEYLVIRKAELFLSSVKDYWAPSCRYSMELYLREGVARERLFLCYYGGYGDKAALYKPPSGILHSQLGVPDGSPLVGMVSYFYKPKRYLLQLRGIKGHEDFIDAFVLLKKSFPELRGVIIGGAWRGAERYVQGVKEKARRLCGGDISFTGHREDLTDIYKELDVAVCPSLTENLGAAAESLAAGVPTVATAVGGFPDIITDGVTGRLARPHCPEGLAQGIKSLLEDRQAALDMASSGRELVTELLSLERCCGDVYKMYRNITGEDDFSPIVSIVIPVFNGGEFLSQAIDSALSQSYKNIEVLVVNDGSTDSGATREVALSYGGRIRYFEKENGGVSSALNMGISNMRGEWFSWLSHDDLYHPDKIKSQVDYLRALSHSGRDVDLSGVVLHGHTQLIDKKGRTIFKMKSYIDNESRLLILNGIRQNRLNGCSFLLHRSLFERFGMFEEAIRTVSDYDMWYRLLFGDCTFHCLPDYMVKTRVHRRQVTYTRRLLAKEEMERFHSGIVKRFYDSGMYSSARDFLKLGGYLLRKGQNKSAAEAFDAAWTLDPSPFHKLRRAMTVGISAVLFQAWTIIKKTVYALLLK